MNYSFMYCDLKNRLKVRYSGHGFNNEIVKVRNSNGSVNQILRYLDPHCTWLVENGYADIAVLVDVGVPDVVDDAQLWWPEWILFRENQVTLEEPALIERVGRTNNQNLERNKMVSARCAEKGPNELNI